MGSGNREEVKVVLIDTRYVVTDQMSFKSVVQNLTGKDSCVSWIEESSFSGEKRKRSSQHVDTTTAKDSLETGAGACSNHWRSLTKDFSFKELDRLMLELPPVEEWHQLWRDDN